MEFYDLSKGHTKTSHLAKIPLTRNAVENIFKKNGIKFSEVAKLMIGSKRSDETNREYAARAKCHWETKWLEMSKLVFPNFHFPKSSTEKSRWQISFQTTKLKGGFTELNLEQKTCYNLENLVYIENIEEAILNYLSEQALILKKSANVFELLNTESSLVANVVFENWDTSDDFNTNCVSCFDSEIENALYITSWSGSNERLDYLVLLNILYDAKNYDYVIVSLPKYNGDANFAVLADLNQIFGFERAFEIESVDTLPPYFSIPEITNYQNFEEKSNYANTHKLPVSDDARELMGGCDCNKFFMIRKFPTEKELQYSLSVLMCLLSKPTNCLINGYLNSSECEEDEFPAFVEENDNDTIVSLGQLEVMALKINNS